MHDLSRIYRMSFTKVYPLYVAKVTKKGRTPAELDQVITWLTGYDEGALRTLTQDDTDLETFFQKAPHFNPNAQKITGMICGYRVEDIEDKVLQKVRYLDKLVDELAKGKTIDKILRK